MKGWKTDAEENLVSNIKTKLKQNFTVRVALKKVAFFHFIKKAIIFIHLFV